MRHGIAYRFRYLAFIIFIISQCFNTLLYAEEEVPQVSYLDVSPPIIVNLSSKTKRMQYLKADIAFKITGEVAKTKVNKHIDAVRDLLVLLLSAQKIDDVDTVAGKEKLRNVALQHVQAFFKKEEGEPLVEDLLFKNIVVQR
ncbi:flagellar basal body-associated FliL family protein [Zooshikella harenae]|uniref:Flagellar protein FliL n=1 Tax=Zooshikella harenae TaxID=2827238 RepID=A0ABS5ZD30_9GAMM|nr:flagellar basal body-associated FliL family protein [Zooshikella harenae]MBU2711884.1 flagellar basal body-associated FliL family protein [Zooshikella harenae]